MFEVRVEWINIVNSHTSQNLVGKKHVCSHTDTLRRLHFYRFWIEISKGFSIFSPTHKGIENVWSISMSCRLDFTLLTILGNDWGIIDVSDQKYRNHRQLDFFPPEHCVPFRNPKRGDYCCLSLSVSVLVQRIKLKRDLLSAIKLNFPRVGTRVSCYTSKTMKENRRRLLKTVLGWKHAYPLPLDVVYGHSFLTKALSSSKSCRLFFRCS